MTTIRVLLVEDDPMVREVNRQFIERVEGFKIVDMASNGIAGIEKIKELTPDLIIMDIFMPVLSYQTFCLPDMRKARKVRAGDLPDAA